MRKPKGAITTQKICGGTSRHVRIVTSPCASPGSDAGDRMPGALEAGVARVSMRRSPRAEPFVAAGLFARSLGGGDAVAGKDLPGRGGVTPDLDPPAAAHSRVRVRTRRSASRSPRQAAGSCGAGARNDRQDGAPSRDPQRSRPGDDATNAGSSRTLRRRGNRRPLRHPRLNRLHKCQPPGGPSATIAGTFIRLP
jgi:hypothetical protein